MKSKKYFLLVVFCCSGLNVFSQSQYDFLQLPTVEGEIQSLPTFNSCSYYYRSSRGTTFRAEYKRANETVWRAAHRTVCDQPVNIHKGSLMNLDEDTEYQIRIFDGSGAEMVRTTFRTWSSAPPIAKTIDLSTIPSTARDGYVITE